MRVEVSNSGSFQAEKEGSRGTGAGLANVRLRLALCLGKDGTLDVSSDIDATTVAFSVPRGASVEKTALHAEATGREVEQALPVRPRLFALGDFDGLLQDDVL